MVEKKKLSIIIYYDSKSKLVFLFSSLFPPSLSLFFIHTLLYSYPGIKQSTTSYVQFPFMQTYVVIRITTGENTAGNKSVFS